MWKLDEKFHQGKNPTWFHQQRFSTFSEIHIFNFFVSISRPPPKVARRVGPIPDAPTTIVETPPSPSNTFHAVNTPTRSNNQSTTSSDSNVKPSQFLRHKHSDEKLPPVLLKHPQNISKSAQNSSSESLINNNTTNEETLHVESFPISERVRD